MKIQELTNDELIELRDSVNLKSTLYADYTNSLGVDPYDAYDFFSKYLDNTEQLWKYENSICYQDSNDYFSDINNYWEYFVYDDCNLIDFRESGVWEDD
jgi:hypothetical protein